MTPSLPQTIPSLTCHRKENAKLTVSKLEVGKRMKKARTIVQIDGGFLQ
jgi:hypothetical protein